MDQSRGARLASSTANTLLTAEHRGAAAADSRDSSRRRNIITIQATWLWCSSSLAHNSGSWARHDVADISRIIEVRAPADVAVAEPMSTSSSGTNEPMQDNDNNYNDDAIIVRCQYFIVVLTGGRMIPASWGGKLPAREHDEPLTIRALICSWSYWPTLFINCFDWK